MIARNGRPVARLVPAPRPQPSRTPGAPRGDLWTAPDLDEADAQLEHSFETSELEP